jgi:predicted dehydrogenase
MAQPLGIGIIGAGGISHSHLLAYRSRVNRDLARVVAIADIDEARAREQAKQYEVEHVFTDWKQLLEHPGVDAVSICTPPFLHVEQSCAALRAGKHVLCEKPMSPTLAGLDEIAAAEREGKAPFAGVFQHRAGQGAQQVRALIDEGRFGRLVFGLSETIWSRDEEYYSMWWRGTWEQECGGVTMGHGIHSIDTLMWFLGEPASIIADATTVKLPIKVEDTSAAIVRFKSGAIGQIVVTVNAQDNRSRLEVFGTNLQAVSAGEPYGPTATPFRYAAIDPSEGERALADAMRLVPDETRHLHVPLVHDFIGAITEGRAPMVPASECRRSMEVITGLYKSAMTGERVTFPIADDDPWYSQIPVAGADLLPCP